MATATASTLDYLDSYCERAGDAALWAEPVNALTNLFFIWFGVVAMRHLLRAQNTPWRRVADLWALALSMVAIGIGSGLWHTYATQHTMLADVIPIGIFINIYIFSLFIRLAQWRWWQAALVWAGFQAMSAASEIYLPREMLNGSVMYLPTLLLLAAAVAVLYARRRSSWRELGYVALLFVASLLFRTMDISVCDTFPMGTHFIWHMVNAVVLYRLIMLLLRTRQSATTD